MDDQSYERWLESRQNHSAQLFERRLDIAPQLGDAALAPLSTLAYNTIRRGTLSKVEAVAEVELCIGVKSILEHHNQMAKADTSAVFCMINPEDLQFVSDLTALVIFRWEQACLKRNLPSPFANLVTDDITDADFTRQDVQLVVEAAAGVLQVLQLGFKGSRQYNDRSFRSLAGLIARRGPHFAEAWMRGEVADQAPQLSAQHKQTIAELSRSAMSHYLLSHAGDPVAAVLKFAKNLRTTLSIENIAHSTGWDEARVAQVFTPHRLREIARGWRSDPLARVKHSARQLDGVLSTQSLASYLGISETEADELLTPSSRFKLTLKAEHPRQKLVSIKRNLDLLDPDTLAETLGWHADEIAQLFPPSYRREILISFDDPWRRAGDVAKAYTGVLSVANLARHIGWAESQTSAVFTPSARQRLTTGDLSRVQDQVDKIVETRAVMIKNLKLPLTVINGLSVRNIPSAYKIAQKVAAEAANCPHDVWLLTWMWAVTRNPNGNAKIWRAYISKMRLLRQLHRPLRLDQPVGERRQLSDFVPGEDGDFVEQIFAHEPGEYLQGLAQTAGVALAQLNQLLKAVEEDGGPLPQDLNQALMKLRGAAQMADL